MNAYELTEKEFLCNHPERELTRKQISNGDFQTVWQCLHCGFQVGNPIKRDEALKFAEGRLIPLFDKSLKETFEKNKKAHLYMLLERERDNTNDDWDNEYQQHLASWEWDEIREKVLRRADYQCEGCWENPATQVHHLTYSTYNKTGKELMFELVALCHYCHELVHSK